MRMFHHANRIIDKVVGEKTEEHTAILLERIANNMSKTNGSIPRDDSGQRTDSAVEGL